METHLQKPNYTPQLCERILANAVDASQRHADFCKFTTAGEKESKFTPDDRKLYIRAQSIMNQAGNELLELCSLTS